MKLYGPAVRRVERRFNKPIEEVFEMLEVCAQCGKRLTLTDQARLMDSPRITVIVWRNKLGLSRKGKICKDVLPTSVESKVTG